MKTPNDLTEGWQLEGGGAEAYERYLASAFSPWAQKLTELADVREGNRVLDVACGTGIVARHAAERAGAAGAIVGLDLNEDMLRVARSVSAAMRPAIEWRQGNATELPFPDEAFDAVCCEQAIQFFSDPVKALGEMRRVMAPGARAAVSVCRPIEYSPAYVALASLLDRHVSPQAGAMMRSPFCRWRLDELRDLFREAGFGDVQVRIEVGSLRYPSCGEFLRREAASSPLAGPVSALRDDLRNELIRELEDALSDHVDDDGVVCGIESYVAVAHRDRSNPMEKPLGLR
jgi:ubiquinone/menaquinone biosynthesis C-methylase UbiE